MRIWLVHQRKFVHRLLICINVMHSAGLLTTVMITTILMSRVLFIFHTYKLQLLVLQHSNSKIVVLFSFNFYGLGQVFT